MRNLIKGITIGVGLIICAVFIAKGIGLQDIAEIMSNGNILCLACIGIG